MFFISLALLIATAVVSTNARPGQCPHLQLSPVGKETCLQGKDNWCPKTQKCCPAPDGMFCQESCPQFEQPCTLQCQFGLRKDSLSCPVCACAEDPCLHKTCPQDSKCVSKEFTPCAVKGQCGMTAQCVIASPLPTTSMPTTSTPTTRIPTTPIPTINKCANLSHSCTLKCQYGLKSDSSSCPICECMEDPCLSKKCPLGTRCVISNNLNNLNQLSFLGIFDYSNATPFNFCTCDGCERTYTQCQYDSSIVIDPNPKPNACPVGNSYPLFGQQLTQCNGTDSSCPDNQKCCRSELPNIFLPPSFGYCEDPCGDISDCALNCSLGLEVKGRCRVCRCIVNPCDTSPCAPDELCTPTISLPMIWESGSWGSNMELVYTHFCGTHPFMSLIG